MENGQNFSVFLKKKRERERACNLSFFFRDEFLIDMLSLRNVLKIIITTIIFLVTCFLYNYLLGKHLSSASYQLQNLLLSIINKESQLSYIHVYCT